MIDFDKKYSYKHCEVDTAHELLWARLSDLAGEVGACCETLEQALWVERHRRPRKRLKMSDGSVRRGEAAENTWVAFNNNDWESLDFENIPELLSKLREALADAGFDTDRQARFCEEVRKKEGADVVKHKYPFIPKGYFAAVMFANKMVQEGMGHNVACERAAQYYQVNTAEVSYHLAKRLDVDQKEEERRKNG